MRQSVHCRGRLFLHRYLVGQVTFGEGGRDGVGVGVGVWYDGVGVAGCCCRDPNYWWARVGLVTGDGVRMNVFGSLMLLSIFMSSLVCGKVR